MFKGGVDISLLFFILLHIYNKNIKMKFVISEQEKKQILSLYGKNISESFLTNLFPSLKKKIRNPYFFIQETPNNKGVYRIYVKDKFINTVESVDPTTIVGKHEDFIDYKNPNDAKSIVDKLNKDIDPNSNSEIKGQGNSGSESFFNEKTLNIIKQQIKKLGYFENVDKVNLPDGEYYAEAFDNTLNTGYNNRDTEEFKKHREKGSYFYKLKYKSTNETDHSSDTGYLILTNVFPKQDVPTNSKVMLKNGRPNSIYWGNEDRIVGIFKNPSIVK